LSILDEQTLNEKARTKIIGLTLETRPDYINRGELRRLRRFGCTRVQIGVQHTDDEILKGINRGHERKHAVQAVKLLKENCFKVDIHLMPDLPGSDPAKDWAMFEDVLFGEDLQADHWKIYPCEVTPFTKIERWFQEGAYKPYTETDPQLLTDLLVKVKAEVHPWIRLNRVIRDIPEVSIIAGNSNTNLRQAIFTQLQAKGRAVAALGVARFGIGQRLLTSFECGSASTDRRAVPNTSSPSRVVHVALAGGPRRGHLLEARS